MRHYLIQYMPALPDIFVLLKLFANVSSAPFQIPLGGGLNRFKYQNVKIYDAIQNLNKAKLVFDSPDAKVGRSFDENKARSPIYIKLHFRSPIALNFF